MCSSDLDDQTLLFAEDGRLFAAAPSNLRGRMEIRGVGIVTIEAAAPAPVVLAVRLDAKGAIPRLPEPAQFVPPAALSLRENPALLTLSPFEASTPAKIAAAAAASIRGGFVAGPISPDRGPFL